jgi:cell division protease FtsH
MHDFEDALDKMLEGQEGTTIIFDRLKRSTSKHEAGHAVCAWLFDRDYQVRSVSVLKNSTSLGRVRRAPLRDEDFYDLDRLKRELTILLAGRAGETFGESAQGTETVGVGQDFKVAYNLARQMVTEWGMGRQTGIIYLPADKSSESTVVCSDELTSRIQADIEELLKTAYENALTTISANKQFFERIVAALEQRGHLRLSDLKELEVKA